MTAKLFVNGIEISVPIGELAEALRQIGSVSTPKQSLPTPARIQQPAETHTANAHFQMPLTTITESSPTHKTTLKFLRLIEDHRLTGAKTGDIMPVIGATKPKGVGSKSAAVNRVLAAHGFSEIDEVYTNQRDVFGERLWKPGPAMGAAIDAIERGLAN